MPSARRKRKRSNRPAKTDGGRGRQQQDHILTARSGPLHGVNHAQHGISQLFIQRSYHNLGQRLS